MGLDETVFSGGAGGFGIADVGVYATQIDSVGTGLRIGLNARKEACKQINEMFGLNIDVEYRDDFNNEMIHTLNTDVNISGEVGDNYE